MNPKDIVGVRKRPSSVVSQAVMQEVAVGILEGALKYGRHNYRVIPIQYSIYYDATRRHLDDWWEGDDIDEDSGLSHVTKAIASLVVLRDAMIQNKVVDDRPPRTSQEHREKMQALVEELMDKYPEPARVYVEGDQDE